MYNKSKAKGGITLIALVVTVIILMILAGITVTLVIGQSGIIGKAKQASTQTKQSSAEEDLKMMLAEYYTNKQTGDTETLKDYLDKQVTAGKIDSEQANGSNYDVILEGYLCTVDSNTLNIIDIAKDQRPQASDIKVVSNSNGTGDNLGDYSMNPGTTLYLTFAPTMSDGSNVTVSPSIPYAITQNGIYNFTLTGTVDGKNTTRSISVEVNQFKIFAKVADFVNYTAGVWTQDEINSLGSLYSGASLPTDINKYQFGGFKVGDSRDNSITPYKNYVNKYPSGWRVLDLNTDGSIRDIVHAGTPEGFYIWDNSSISESILTSERKWNMYVNSTYATSAHCMVLNEILDSYEIRTTGSYYWLASVGDPYGLYHVFNDGDFNNGNLNCYGIRPVVTLKSGIEVAGGSGTWADPYQMK